jgi:hypothetical protein
MRVLRYDDALPCWDLACIASWIFFSIKKSDPLAASLITFRALPPAFISLQIFWIFNVHFGILPLLVFPRFFPSGYPACYHVSLCFYWCYYCWCFYLKFTNQPGQYTYNNVAEYLQTRKCTPLHLDISQPSRVLHHNKSIR